MILESLVSVCLLLSVPSYIPGKLSAMDPTEGPAVFPHRGFGVASSISHSPSQLGSGLWPGFPQADLPHGIWKKLSGRREAGPCFYWAYRTVGALGLPRTVTTEVPLSGGKDSEQSTGCLASTEEMVVFLLAGTSIMSRSLSGSSC